MTALVCAGRGDQHAIVEADVDVVRCFERRALAAIDHERVPRVAEHEGAGRVTKRSVAMSRAQRAANVQRQRECCGGAHRNRDVTATNGIRRFDAGNFDLTGATFDARDELVVATVVDLAGVEPLERELVVGGWRLTRAVGVQPERDLRPELFEVRFVERDPLVELHDPARSPYRSSDPITRLCA